MKNFKFILFLALSSIYILSGTEANSLDQNGEKIEWCYCSFKCGPRQVQPDDKPFYDPEYGQCFCKKRDQDYYVKNGCADLPKPNYTSYCDTRGKTEK